MVIKDFESVFDHIGGFGRYQLWLFLVNCYMSILLAFVYFGQIFMSITPPHFCRPPPDIENFNFTLEQTRELTIPIDPETKEFSKCTGYDVSISKILQSNLSTLPDRDWNITSCTYGWTYEYGLYYPTITSELNWVCDEDWKPAFSQSMFFVGSLVGVPILGWAADKWGRIPVIVVTNVVGGVMGIASGFAQNLVIFTILRFIVGLTYDTQYFVLYILVLEYASSKYRTVMGNVPIMIFLTAAMCSLPWIGVALGHWTYLSIAIHAPQLLCIFFICLVPESARWLLGKGRLDDTLKIVTKAARVNGKVLTTEFIDDFKEYGRKQAEEESNSKSVLDLFKTPVLRMRFILLCVMWVTIMLAYDGHMRNTENVGFNVFVSFTVLGFVELPADFLAILSMEWAGRRYTTFITLILSGVACFVIAPMPEEYTVTIFALAIAGRFLITMTINVGQQYVVEILPTVARSSGSGAIHTLGSVSMFISPYVVYLSKFGLYAPYLILGFVAIVGGAISSMLPETKDEKLPDSLEDGENYFRGQKCCPNPCSRSQLTGRHYEIPNDNTSESSMVLMKEKDDCNSDELRSDSRRESVIMVNLKIPENMLDLDDL